MIKIEYENRYSSTEEFDDFGRWARLANFNGVTIAWINKIQCKDEFAFSISCHFPTKYGATANEHKICDTLVESKEFIKERWEWFNNNVLNETTT
jgi:hypothetical protein